MYVSILHLYFFNVLYVCTRSCVGKFCMSYMNRQEFCMCIFVCPTCINKKLYLSFLYDLYESTRIMYVSILLVYFLYVLHKSTKKLCVSILYVFICLTTRSCICIFHISTMNLREFCMCLFRLCIFCMFYMNL